MPDIPSHPLLRAKERYGLDLTYSDLWQLVKTIKDKKSVCMDRVSSKEIHYVLCKDVPVVVLYDAEIGRICSFFPLDCLHTGRLRLRIDKDQGMKIRRRGSRRGGSRCERKTNARTRHDRQLQVAQSLAAEVD